MIRPLAIYGRITVNSVPKLNYSNISIRRIDVVWKEYLTTGEIPVVGKGVGRSI